LLLFSTRGSPFRLLFFPIEGSVFGGFSSNLFDVCSWMLSLVLLLTSFQIVRNTTLDNLITLL